MMKKLVALFAFFCLALAAQAQPAVVFEKSEHQAGEIPRKGGAVTCEYAFTNTGDQPLVILGAQGSCDCTKVSYPRKPVLPGQSAVVTVQYNPRKQPQGKIYKTIRVYTNEPEGQHVLIFTGTVL